VRSAVSAPDRTRLPLTDELSPLPHNTRHSDDATDGLLVAGDCLHDSGYSTSPSPGSQPISLSYIMGQKLQTQIKCTFRAVIKPYSMLITDSTIKTTLQMVVSSFIIFIIFSTTCFGRKRNFRPKLVLNVVLMEESVINID